MATGGHANLDAVTGKVVENSLSPQTVEIAKAGVIQGTRDEINFIDGSGASVTVTDNPGSGRVDVTISATGTGGVITSINTDATAAQVLAVGTAGTDYAIVDNGTGTHTFNLPTASASNRGALSTTDWSTFNGKQAGDATLTSLAAYNTNGLMTQTAADTFTGRTLTGTTSRVAITNGDGVSGNPTLDIDAAYVGQSSITTLGTVSTGTWSATTIALNKGGTGQTTQTTAFDALSPTTTKGDIIVDDGTDAIRLAVGSNTQVLTADSGETSGVKWATPAASTLTGTMVAAFGNGTTTQNFTHGLGVTPSYVRFTVYVNTINSNSTGVAYGANNKCIWSGFTGGAVRLSDADNSNCIHIFDNVTTRTATAALGSTNVTLTWSTGSNTDIMVMCESFA